MAEKGNAKLNTKEYKVVAFKIPKFIEVMKLNYNRDDRNYQAFLSSLEEIQIIDRVEPDISTLKNLKVSMTSDQVVRVFVKRDIKLLDDEIKSIHLVTK
jgi:hypothetical protein